MKMKVGEALLLFGFIGIALTMMLAFLWAPSVSINAFESPAAQRIFYWHVPSAWAAFIAFGVLFVGSAGPRKGFIDLLEAFKRLSHPRKRLILIGSLLELTNYLLPLVHIVGIYLFYLWVLMLLHLFLLLPALVLVLLYHLH